MSHLEFCNLGNLGLKCFYTKVELHYGHMGSPNPKDTLKTSVWCEAERVGPSFITVKSYLMVP